MIGEDLLVRMIEVCRLPVDVRDAKGSTGGSVLSGPDPLLAVEGSGAGEVCWITCPMEPSPTSKWSW
jgi:hypothetical protein